MEIGHNVMHGQWDWMNHPEINSATWDWDSASTPEAWKHSHNYVHHTFTNIRGKDKDLGYEIMRIDPHQRWHPVYLFQPFYNLVLMGLFEWGVAIHDLDAGRHPARARRAGPRSDGSSRGWGARPGDRSPRTTSPSRCSAACSRPACPSRGHAPRRSTPEARPAGRSSESRARRKLDACGRGPRRRRP